MLILKQLLHYYVFEDNVLIICIYFSWIDMFVHSLAT